MKKVLAFVMLLMLLVLVVGCSPNEQGASGAGQTSEPTHSAEVIEPTLLEPTQSILPTEVPTQQPTQEPQKTEFDEIDISDYGISVSLPADSRVFDNREEGGTLGFTNVDKSWILLFVTIDAGDMTNETLVSETDVAKHLKAGYEESAENIEYLVDGTTMLDGEEVLHIIYAYTRDGEQARAEHIIFVENGKVIDMSLNVFDLKDEDAIAILEEIKDSVRFK